MRKAAENAKCGQIFLPQSDAVLAHLENTQENDLVLTLVRQNYRAYQENHLQLCYGKYAEPAMAKIDIL